jgi:hypothetical protein
VANRGPLLGVAALVGVLAVGAMVGILVGVGPLAAGTPPEQVTDPKEMLARSLQSVIDASSVHLAARVEGHVPGALLDRPEATVELDGTRVEADARPKDARTTSHVEIPALDAMLDTVTVWDGAWYRTDPAGAWERASLGDVAAYAGVDANPLTLVDRLRGYLADPEVTPTVTDVACGAPSGRCRHIVLEAGTDPTGLLALLLPKTNRDALPPVDTTVTLDTDVATLRPVQLAVDMHSDDGTVDLHLVVDASRWDEPITIDEPAGS